LGFYTLAYRLSNMPATHITKLVSSIMFPAFSKIQQDRERIRNIFFQTIHAVGLVSVPISVATIVLGPNFVHQYYLGKWDGAILSMQWLTIYGLIRSVAANMGPIMRAMGKPQWLSGLALWRLLTMAALLYPAILWRGVEGVSILSAVVAIVDFAIAAWLIKRLIGGSYFTYLHLFTPPLFAAGLAAGGGWLMLNRVPPIHRLFPLLVALGVMAVIYGLIMWLLDDMFRQMIGKMIQRLRPTPE
jgi:PST family polysaccharide transporter/lipopolysaccharide exporter